jgi:hypothetical protein
MLQDFIIKKCVLFTGKSLKMIEILLTTNFLVAEHIFPTTSAFHLCSKQAYSPNIMHASFLVVKNLEHMTIIP